MLTRRVFTHIPITLAIAHLITQGLVFHPAFTSLFGFWKWDTEIHSSAALWTSSSTLEYISSAFSSPDQGVFGRYAVSLSSGVEMQPYFSTPAIGAFMVYSLDSILQSMGASTQAALVLVYGLNALASALMLYVFARSLRGLLGEKVALFGGLALIFSPWVVLDSTSVHWNPFFRFATFFLTPAIVILLERGKKLSAIGLGACSVFLSTINGFELLGFAASSALILMSFLNLGYRRVVTILLSFVAGLSLSALSWLVTLSVRLDRSFPEVIDFVSFISTKHAIDTRLAVPSGAVGQALPANLGDAFRAILLESSPLVPLNFQSSLVTGLVPYVIFAFSNLTFTALLLWIFYKQGRLWPDHLVFALGLLAFSLSIALLKNYVVNHGHILGIAGVLQLLVPIVIASRMAKK